MVGHDLNRGTTTFTRAVRTERPETGVDAEADALHRQEPSDLAEFDSFGNPLTPPDLTEPAAAGVDAA